MTQTKKVEKTRGQRIKEKKKQRHKTGRSPARFDEGLDEPKSDVDRRSTWVTGKRLGAILPRGGGGGEKSSRCDGKCGYVARMTESRDRSAASPSVASPTMRPVDAEDDLFSRVRT